MKLCFVLFLWPAFLLLFGAEPIRLGTHEAIPFPLGVIAWGEKIAFVIDVENASGYAFSGTSVSCGCLRLLRVGSEKSARGMGMVDHFSAEIDPLYRLGKTGLLATFSYKNSDNNSESAVVNIVGEVRHRVGIEMRKPMQRMCSGVAESLTDSVRQGAEVELRITHGGVNGESLGNILASTDNGAPWVITGVVRDGLDPAWIVRLRLDAPVLLGGAASTVLTITPQDEQGTEWGTVRKLTITAPVQGVLCSVPRALVWRKDAPMQMSLWPSAMARADRKSGNEFKKVMLRDVDRQMMVTLNADEIEAARASGAVLIIVADPQADLVAGFSGTLRICNIARQVVFQLPLAVLSE